MKLASRVSAVFFLPPLIVVEQENSAFGILPAIWRNEIVDFFVKLERNIFFRQIDFWKLKAELSPNP